MKKISMFILIALGVAVLFVSNKVYAVGTLAFEAGVNIATNETNTRRVELADLDHDGDLDVLWSNYDLSGSSDVKWARNDGDNVFVEQPAIATGLQGPWPVLAEDLDRDGDLDVVVATADSLLWYANDGNGNFTVQPLIATLSLGAADIVLGDIDQDGDIDIIMSSTYGSIIRYSNNGSGSFTATETISATTGSLDLELGDLDNDGDLDLVVADSYSDEFTWYLFNGSSYVSQGVLLASTDAASVVIADFNQDGYNDIVTGSFGTDTATVFLNNGDQTFSSGGIITTTADGIRDIVSADIDHDGDLDLLIASFLDDTIEAFTNDGNATFTPYMELSNSIDGVYNLAVGDTDQDGDLDVLASSYFGHLVVFYENTLNQSYLVPTVTFDSNGGSSISSYELTPNNYVSSAIDLTGAVATPTKVETADLNNDGQLDVVSVGGNAYGSGGNLEWFLNNGDLTFTKQTTIYEGTNVKGLQLADLDQDGWIDIVISDYDASSILWFKNNSGTSFTVQTAISTTTLTSNSILAQDFDNDGDIDILSANNGSNFTWFKNNGSGTFTEQTSFSHALSNTFDIQGADIDRDGFIDFVVADINGDEITWYKNNSGNSFTVQTSISTTVNGPHALTIADFNNDGFLDVASANINDGYTWYLNDGDGTFTTQTQLGTAAQPRGIIAVDFNRDGYQDIIGVSNLTAKVSYFENNKDNTFTETVISTEGSGLFDLVVDDFYIDGYLDIIVADFNGYKLTLYKNGAQNYTVVEPTAPTKTGNTFDGWYLDAGFASLYDFNSTISNSMTLYAKWSVNDYIVTYDTKGGSALVADTIAYDSTLSLQTPTRDGYTFDGWYEDDALTTPLSYTNMPAMNMTVYAKWSVINYDINYNYNGGAADSEDILIESYSVESELLHFVNAVREGYTFDGWYEASDFSGSTVSWTQGQTGDITVYAKWTANDYTVTYDTKGGPALTDDTVTFDTVLALQTPTRDGYTFGGWYEDDSLTTSLSYTNMPAMDLTLYAKWDLIIYNITFNYNGGIEDENDPQFDTYNIDTEVFSYGSAVREGYTFDGWYETSDFSGSVASWSSGQLGDLTLYAKWTALNYDLSFETNGGNSINSQVVSTDTTLDLTAPVREGYTFDGWYIDQALTTMNAYTNMPAMDLTLYAKWTINQYTITFVVNGGTTLNPITADYMSAVTAPENPTKDGYTFNGYDMEIPSTMPAEDLTIEVFWLRVTHEVDGAYHTDRDTLYDAIDQADVLGKDVEVILYVDSNIQTIDDDDNQLIIDFIDNHLSSYLLNINVILREDGASDIYVTTLENEITITLDLPEEIHGYKDYQIIRVHDGVAEIIDSIYDEDAQTISFDTDKFSTYGIIYNEGSGWAWWLLLLLLLPLGWFIWFFLIKNDDDDDEEEDKPEEIKEAVLEAVLEEVVEGPDIRDVVIKDIEIRDKFEPMQSVEAGDYLEVTGDHETTNHVITLKEAGQLPEALKNDNRFISISSAEKKEVAVGLVALKTHEKKSPGSYAEPGYYVEVDVDGSVVENYILLKKRLPPTSSKGHRWVQIKKIDQ